jgi:hypothetical protein
VALSSSFSEKSVRPFLLGLVTGLGYSLFPRHLSDPEGSKKLRKIFFAALFVVLVAVPVASIDPVLAFSPPLVTMPFVSPQKQAVILSSLDQVYPMAQYNKDITHYLNQLGYQVTTLTDSEVTLNLLLTQLNNYSIIIWRTNTYTWKHVEYWYVGQLANSAVETQYATDFAQGWINGNAGILGVSMNFFTEHFTSGVLSNVKLMILMSSDSDVFASTFVNAGATTVIFCNGAIGLAFGEIDDLTNQVVAGLTMGQSVYTAVYGAVSPNVQHSNPDDPLDTGYTPPFWYVGDGTLTLTA